MDTINISTFKATCLARLHQVKQTGRPLLVTRKGEPVAEIRPPAPAPAVGSWLGALAGTGRITGDLVAPASAKRAWEVLR
jgi:antitoxin (DNA-binding transcriptional repressor) of toxin-antitoxin stability system